jgi:peptidoglycan/LPS O-acetylase OafA/YrhL
MTAEPWYDLNTQIWLGVAGGVFGGLWGSALGVLAGLLIPKGKGKRLIFGLLWVGLVLGVASGVAGVVALVSGQPYGVWYPLLLGCVPLTPLAVVFLFVVRHRYRQVELRKMQADELGA